MPIPLKIRRVMLALLAAPVLACIPVLDIGVALLGAIGEDIGEVLSTAASSAVAIILFG